LKPFLQHFLLFPLEPLNHNHRQMATRSAAVQIRPPSSTTSVCSSPRPVLGSISHPAIPASPTQQKVSNADHQAHGESNGSNQFNHQTSATTSTGRKSSPSSPRKFSLPHPTRPATATPIASSGAGLTTNAPIFVPSGTVNPYHLPGRSGQQVKLNKAAAEFAPSGLVPTSDVSQYLFLFDEVDYQSQLVTEHHIYIK